MRRFLVSMLAIAGVAASLLSCGMMWFAIPVGAEPLGVAPGAIQISQPQWTIAFRLVVIVALAIVVLCWAIGKAGSWGLVAASLWLAALLTYPYAIMNWEPTIAGDAAWLEAQHRNLIWSGGDLNMSVGHRIEGVMDKILLTQTPRSVNPVEVSEWRPSELSLARLPNLVDRLGYSNKFFEFLRLGWVVALGGCLLILTAIGAPGGYVHVGRLVRMSGIVSASIIVLCVTAWCWSFAAAADLASAAESTARGEYQAALDAMQRAKQKLPSLGEDSYFIAQQGLLEDALGKRTSEVRLYRADLDELAGKRHQADVAYESLIADADTPSPVRREACRALLRSAIDALNAGRTNAAAKQLEQVLATEPCNLKANYALQFAYLRSGHYRSVPQLAQRLEAVYRSFQFPSKLAAVSASYQNAVVADAARGNTELAVAHGRKVAKP